MCETLTIVLQGSRHTQISGHLALLFVFNETIYGTRNRNVMSNNKMHKFGDNMNA